MVAWRKTHEKFTKTEGTLAARQQRLQVENEDAAAVSPAVGLKIVAMCVRCDKLRVLDSRRQIW